jgi:hypothetical protein
MPPAVAALLYAAVFAPVHPDWDGWVMIGLLYSHWVNSESLWHILLYKTGEHPWGLPIVVFILLGGIVNYQYDLFAILSTGTVVAVALLLLICAWRAGTRSFLSLSAIAVVMLSLRQGDNFLLAFQMGFTLTVFFGVLASIFSVEFSEATSPRYRAATFFGLIAALIAGGFCSAASFAAVPAVAFPLLYRRDRAALAALMVVATLLGAWLYLFSGGHAPTAAWSPLGMLVAFFLLCGLLFSNGISTLLLAGFIVIVLFVWLAAANWSCANRGQRALITSGIFALGALALIAYGRGSDVGQVLPHPRYRTFTALLTAITVFLVIHQLARWSAGPIAQLKAGKRLLYAGRLLVFSAVVWSLAFSVKFAIDWSWMEQHRDTAVIASVIDHHPQELEHLIPFIHAEYSQPLIDFMDHHSLNVFAHREYYSRFIGNPLSESSPKMGHEEATDCGRLFCVFEPLIRYWPARVGTVRFSEQITDKVSCAPRGLRPDGKPDGLVEIDYHLSKRPWILRKTEIRLVLERTNPIGGYETGSHLYPLGITATPNGDLLNRSDGSFVPKAPATHLWAHFCRDGHDQPDSVYRLNIEGERFDIASP